MGLTIKNLVSHMPVKRALSLIVHGNKVLILSQALFVMLFYLLLLPLLTIGFEILLKTSNVSYITLGNLSAFLLSPLTFLFGIVLITVFSLLVLFEDQFLKEYFYFKHNHMDFNILSFYFHVLTNVFETIKKQHFYAFVSAWTRMLTFNLPLIFFVTRESQLLEFLKNETSRVAVWGFIILCYAILVAISHRKASHMLWTLLYWNIIQGFAYLAIYTLLMVITILIITGTVEHTLAVPALITLSTRIHQYYIVFLMLASTLTHYALYSLVNAQALGTLDTPTEVSRNITYKELISTRSRRLIFILIMVVLSADIYYTLQILKNGSALQINTFEQIQITSHRGYSYNYPENTLPAIEYAIESFADYVEIDVRVTKDGVFVLMHDNTLRRTTGVRKAIWDVTYDDIKDLDAGSWMDASFSEVRIPTLIEVFESTKGRVYLNLDLKFNKDQTDVVQRLIELIDAYDMQYQCVITSTCLECLEAIKILNPNIQTGYITYRITPQLLMNSNIDVFSMKSSLVTKSVVEKAHAYGKKVLVWTVNTRREIEQLSRLGVDNLITDRPSYAKDVLYKSTGDQYLITLLKVILD